MDFIGYKTCKLFVFFNTFTCRGSRVYIRNQPPRLTGQVTWCCTRVVSPFPFYHEDEELHWVGKDGSSEQTTVFPIIQGVVESAVHHTAVPACSLKNPRVETYYTYRFFMISKKITLLVRFIRISTVGWRSALYYSCCGISLVKLFWTCWTFIALCLLKDYLG